MRNVPCWFIKSDEWVNVLLWWDDKNTPEGAWAAGAPCLFCLIWNDLRRQTARFDRFSCICTIRGAKCATEAYFGVFRGVLLIVWCVPWCVWGVLRPEVVRNESLLERSWNGLQTGCKQPANRVQTDCKRGENGCCRSVKNTVKIGMEGHLEGQFGGTANFLIYCKNRVFGGTI